MVSGSYQIIYCLVLTQGWFLQSGLWKLPNHILSCPYSSRSFTKWCLEATKSYIVLPLLKYVFYKMVSGSYQIIYCLALTQVCLLQNGHRKLPNHILSCPYSSMSFTKWSLEATKSYIVLSLLKHVFYKKVTGSYQVIYCLVLTQVCLLQNGFWKLPNHILSCPYSSMSFTKWFLEATKSYIVLSLLKYVFYKMVSGSYQVIYCLVLTQVCLLQSGLWKLPNNILSCPNSSRSFTNGFWKLPNHILPCPYLSMSFTKWSLEATKSYIVLS